MPLDCSDEFFSLLPFSPTNAQRRCVREALRDMAAGCPTVSYTHLDVYKRQTMQGVLMDVEPKTGKCLSIERVKI